MTIDKMMEDKNLFTFPGTGEDVNQLQEDLIQLEKACEGAVGKTDSAGNDLPLWMHMSDVAGTMKLLYCTRLSDSQKDFLISDLQKKGIDQPEKTLEKAIVLLGFSHDLGKMTAIFQSMMNEHLIEKQFKLPLPAYGSFADAPYRHHAASGMLILLSLGYNADFASIAGAHHGKTQNKITAQKIQTEMDCHEMISVLYGSRQNRDFWKDAWQKISSSVLKICGFSSSEEVPSFSVPSSVILCGLLVEADWIGSNTEYFPLCPESNNPAVTEYPKRWQKAAAKLDLPSVWKKGKEKMDEAGFISLFGFPPNPVQKAVLQIENESARPGLLIIEAQMGVGKTEAALAAADILGGKLHSGGVYFGLPTQATANGLFPRFAQWSKANANQEGNTFKLAHGMAGFNEAYQNMPHGPVRTNEDEQIKNGETSGSVFIHEWMQNPKTGTLSDFVLGTVDQGLMMALNHKHFMLRHLGLSGKVVIIDEVHAYDAYMSVFFNMMLEWLGAYHVPVVLLSATLPSSKKVSMVESYLKGLTGQKRLEMNDESWKKAKGYPILTWTDGEQVFYHVVQGVDERNKKAIHVEKVYVNKEDLNERVEDLLKKQLKNGGCAGVVVNTVNTAQELARYLESRMDDCSILLFHSRYLAEDRSSIEKEVLQKVGKSSDSSTRNRLIVVGTQVIEQSLDVDFDVMISMLAPMDLLLQRMGRLHRHTGRKERPERLQKPLFYVLIPDKEEMQKKIIYEPWILMKTEQALPETVHLPEDIPELVERVYGDDHPENEEEERAYHAMQDTLQKMKDKAKTGTLEKPNDFRRRVKSRKQAIETLNGLMKPNVVMDEDTAVHSVRDISPSIDIYLLARAKDHDYRIEANGEEILLDAEKKLSFTQERQLAGTKISIPFGRNEKDLLDNVQNQLREDSEKNFSVWKKNGLFKDALFAVLDSDGRLELGNRFYRYSKRFGLERE